MLGAVGLAHRIRGRDIDMANYAGVSTKYYGPTNYRGSRIRVVWGDDRVTVPYDHSEPGSAHVAAVREAMTVWGYETVGVTYVAETESRRGSVYRVEYAELAAV
jgi:hypothetical protein